MLPTLGSEIRRRREALGMSQAELGSVIGYSQKQMSDLERDRKRFPEPHQLRALAHKLRCKPDDILRTIGYTEGVEDLAVAEEGFHYQVRLILGTDLSWDELSEETRRSILHLVRLEEQSKRRS